jgi:ABC-type Zn uptake system ZnuABC Zn-binding protein ZnuA
MNGLGLDEWLRDLVQNAGAAHVPIVELAEDLEGVEYLVPADHGHEEEDEHEEDEHEEDEHEEDDEHSGETANPHLWLNVAYAQKYVEKLVQTLKEVDPDDAADYDANGAAYLQRLTDLEAFVVQQMATVPEENRRVVSFHEAFPYFAAAYGLEIVGTVIDAPGQEASAGEVAALIEAIRGEGVSAIFAESQLPRPVCQWSRTSTTTRSAIRPSIPTRGSSAGTSRRSSQPSSDQRGAAAPGGRDPCPWGRGRHPPRWHRRRLRRAHRAGEGRPGGPHRIAPGRRGSQRRRKKHPAQGPDRTSQAVAR